MPSSEHDAQAARYHMDAHAHVPLPHECADETDQPSLNASMPYEYHFVWLNIFGEDSSHIAA